MLPLTVNIYMSDAEYEFDTVIFDEVSQICTEAVIFIFIFSIQVKSGDKLSRFQATASDEFYQRAATSPQAWGIC
jgi:hypothetical protein